MQTTKTKRYLIGMYNSMTTCHVQEWQLWRGCGVGGIFFSLKNPFPVFFFLDISCVCLEIIPFWLLVCLFWSFTAQSVYQTILLAVNQYCAHSFARNWQLPFRRKWFMINLRERMLPTRRAELATSWSPVGRTSNWDTEAGSGYLLLCKNEIGKHMSSVGRRWHRVL